MLWVDKDTVAICKDEWSILLGEDGKPYQDEYKSNIKYVKTDLKRNKTDLKRNKTDVKRNKTDLKWNKTDLIISNFKL